MDGGRASDPVTHSRRVGSVGERAGDTNPTLTGPAVILDLICVGGRNHPWFSIKPKEFEFFPCFVHPPWGEGRKGDRDDIVRIIELTVSDWRMNLFVFHACFKKAERTSLYYRGPTSFVDISFVGRPRTTLRKATFHVLFNRERERTCCSLLARRSWNFSYSWMFALSI